MMKKTGLIIAESPYPIGSMSIRIRMWAKGFLENNVLTKVFIVAPRPTKYAIENADPYVIFALPPTLKTKRNTQLLFSYQRIIGIVHLWKFLIKEKDLSFILIAWPNILLGTFLLFFCRRNKVLLFFDKGDENGRMIDKKNTSLLDYLAKLNQKYFNKFIIPRVDVLFVVSSYLEKKYNKLYPALKIKRSLPTLIDYNEFLEYQKNDVFELEQKGFEILKSEKPKVFYAGSCERTNGLFFFLENAAQLLIHEKISFEIILILVDGDIDKIKRSCLKLGISLNVTFLDPVLPKYMPAIYKSVDILILPEQGTIIANAGFPGKTGEYLASGKAILSTIFSDLTDHLKNGYNAMLAQIGDRETYCNNLKRLILDEGFRAELGQNAIKTVQKDFDYKQGVLRYIEEL
jgi:glycosyltransferase involved in cell wall biosynthesis